MQNALFSIIVRPVARGRVAQTIHQLTLCPANFIPLPITQVPQFIYGTVVVVGTAGWGGVIAIMAKTIYELILGARNEVAAVSADSFELADGVVFPGRHDVGDYWLGRASDMVVG